MAHFLWHKAAVVVAAILALHSCASLNPVGLARLAALDPLSADPAQIAVAARLPMALKLRTGDLVMTVKTDVTEGPGKIDETFLLEVADAAPGDAGAITPEAGERLQTARIARLPIPPGSRLRRPRPAPLRPQVAKRGRAPCLWRPKADAHRLSLAKDRW
jgi:hypothetical protein